MTTLRLLAVCLMVATLSGCSALYIYDTSGDRETCQADDESCQTE